MNALQEIEAYRALDIPQVLQYLFHPRPQFGSRAESENRKDIMIPVESGVNIGGSLHISGTERPTLLFFHGNGEIVSDYDDLGQVFAKAGMNFMVVDYRGYGISDGTPGVCAMLKDSHVILDFALSFLKDHGFKGALGVMGRSLGSASAIELAKNRAQEFDCLVVESGFAWIQPLLTTLGISMPDQFLSSDLENVEKIKLFEKPCLIIHAQYDHIIPFSDGQALYEACGSTDKRFLEIKGANHNDLFLKGMSEYVMQLQALCGIN